MRIEKIRIENLNALYGIHEIDFTAPEFAQNNLFLLWGDMGSGKTTVLDGITLALFGRTSRLGQIGSSNEILSKGMRQCSAEVTFRLDDCRYRARWSQEINRNQNFNAQKREICRIGENGAHDEIIDDRNGTIDKSICQLIKLNYEQFTKAVLLEQGKFSEFMSAKEDERAIILEQLTGTAIYTTLSRNAYDLARKKEDACKAARKELESVSLMSPDDIAKLKEKETMLGAEQIQLKADLERLSHQINWLNDLGQLENRWNALQIEQHNHQKRINDFQNNRKRLEDANRASKVNPHYQIYKKDCDDLAQKQLLQSQQKAHYPTAELAVQTAVQHLHDCEAASLGAKQVLDSKQPVFKRVRSLQSELDEKKSALQSISEKQQRNQAELRTQREIYDRIHKEIAKLQQRLDNAVAFFSQNAADEFLAEELAGIHEKSRQLSLLAEDIEKAETAHKNAETIHRKAQNDYRDAELRVREEEKKIATILENEQVIREAYQLALNGSKREDLEALRNSYIQQKLYAITVSSLKDFRRSLQNGHACPLCGSTHHPYCEGQLPQVSEVEEKLERVNRQIAAIDEAKTRLDAAEKESRTCTDALNNLRLNLEKCRLTLESTGQDAKEKTSFCHEKMQRMHTQLADFNALVEKYGEIADDVSKIKSIMLHLNERQKIWKNALDLRDKLQSEWNNKTQERADLEKTIALLDQKAQEIQSEYAKKNAEIEAKQAEIFELFGDGDVDAEENRLNQMISQTDMQKEQAQRALSEANIELEKCKTKIGESQTAIEKLQESLVSSQTCYFDELRLRGFDDEASFFAARMDENDLDVLTQTARQIDATTLDLQGQARSLKQQIDEKRSQNLTEAANETLIAERSQKSAQFDANQAEIFQISGQLAEQKKKSAHSESLQKTLQSCEAEYSRWKALCDLIGSSDGKKFRQFAQSITFNMLINNANHYLREKKLMERYELVRQNGGDQSLEFLVQDYQTGKIRPARNLSGGEKFCLSLALALALSEMASSNVVIDSLFIDEGLGTLDDQTLDAALTMLKNLSDSRRSRLVGLITHISRARELVTTQIVAEKLGGGRSRLVGPGCTSVKTPPHAAPRKRVRRKIPKDSPASN